jgi:hypothetical protein
VGWIWARRARNGFGHVPDESSFIYTLISNDVQAFQLIFSIKNAYLPFLDSRLDISIVKVGYSNWQYCWS